MEQNKQTLKERFAVVGQNQIIAKTLLIILGISFSLTVLAQCFILNNLIWELDFLTEFIISITTVVIFIAVLAAIIKFFIINNNWLIAKILPNEEPVENPKAWFTSSLRIGLVLLGLILFAKSQKIIFLSANFLIDLPKASRELITNIVQGNRVFENGFPYLQTYHLLMLFLMIYLIAGAPKFVWWQSKRFNA
ncbi:MAG: hypothetical protein A2Y12_06080 [Planctomycetes bacterium GWF2_42_9]|nr:MAG: hypothetical protein A2Y12_06080 [Planctomycetes bacterium GWF2_42_9]